MLTEKQINRLQHMYRIAEPLRTWCLEKSQNQSNISIQAMETIEQLLDMPFLEQKKYVILDDVLIESPQNLQTHKLKVGKVDK